MAQARSAQAINQREKTRIHNLKYGPRDSVSKIFIISLRLIRHAVKETSKSQAEGSTATKIAVPKFQKLNLLAVKFEIVACKIQTVFSTSLCNRNDMKNSLDDVLSKF